jgi:hypothetical protein
MIAPGVPLPAMPPPSSTSTPSAGGSSVLGDIGHDLASAGKAAGEGVVGGIVIIGGIVGTLLTPSGQIAR